MSSNALSTSLLFSTTEHEHTHPGQSEDDLAFLDIYDSLKFVPAAVPVPLVVQSVAVAVPVAVTTGMSMKAGQSTKTGMSMKAGMSTKTGQSVKSKAMTIGIEGKTSDDAWEEEIKINARLLPMSANHAAEQSSDTNTDTNPNTNPSTDTNNSTTTDLCSPCPLVPSQ